MGTGAFNYTLTLYFAKLALFLLYYRLFASHHGSRIAIYLGIVVNGLFSVSIAISYCVICIPGPGESWISKKCTRSYMQDDVQGAFNVASDLYIFVLPLPVLSSLQMPFGRKLGVAATFSTGLIAVIASAISLYYRVLQKSFSDDFTWKFTPIFGLAVVEVSVGVICSSVPHIPALFRRHGPRLSHISSWLHGFLCGWRLRPKKNPGLSLHHCKQSNPNTAPLPRMQVNTQVLNSIQGGENLVMSGRISRDYSTQISTELSGNVSPCHHARATRRDYYERPISPQVVTSHDPALCRAQQLEVSLESAAGEHSGNRSDSRQKGYWDVMSIFRSRNKNSTVQAESCSRAPPGDPDSTSP